MVVEAVRTAQVDLQSEIRSVDVSRDAEFTRILRLAKHEFALTDREIADAFGVSRPTVSRWLDGSNFPHRAFRPLVVRWIQSKAKARARIGTRLAGGSR
jgi:predicted DNA-binding transcriptional regulator AlpA